MKLIKSVLWSFFLNVVVPLSMANEAVPLSVKYQTIGQDGTCKPADASTIFVRQMGLPGCNPTFNGNPMGYDSWTVACDAEEIDWDITWFNDTLTCAGSPVETAVQTAGCETNDKQETEAFFCSPAFLENSNIAFDRFTLKLDLFRDDACSEAERFMSQYLIPNQCVVQSDTASQLFVPDASSNTGTVRSFNSGDCSGQATESTIPVGTACFPYSENEDNTAVLAWAKIGDIAADIVADLPAVPNLSSSPTIHLTFEPTFSPSNTPTHSSIPSMTPSSMPSKTKPTSSANTAHTVFCLGVAFTILASVGLL